MDILKEDMDLKKEVEKNNRILEEEKKKLIDLQKYEIIVKIAEGNYKKYVRSRL